MLRVRTVFTGVQGTPWYSNFYFGGNTEGEAAAASVATDAFWGRLAPNMCTPLVWEVEQDVPTINATTDEITENFVVAPQGGAAVNSNPAMPLAAQALLRWRTGDYVAGRELRGRTSIPYLANAYVTDGRPSAILLSSLTAAATSLLSESAGAGGFAVYSRTHHQWSLVNAGTPWTEFSVMRSRRD